MNNFFLGTSFVGKAKLLYINDIQLLGLLYWLLSICIHSQSLRSRSLTWFPTFFRTIDGVNDHVLSKVLACSNKSFFLFMLQSNLHLSASFSFYLYYKFYGISKLCIAWRNNVVIKKMKYQSKIHQIFTFSTFTFPHRKVTPLSY